MEIKLDRVTKKYNGETVIDDLSGVFKTGGRYLLRGASGAGKTTLLRIIAGLEKPDSGAVTISYGRSGAGSSCFGSISSAAEDIDAQNGAARFKAASSGQSYKEYRQALKSVRLGMVFQEDRLCAEIDAADNIRIVNPDISRSVIDSELRRLLPDEDLEKPVSRLSGGMMRRVAIIRACIGERDIYLLDEPFTGLDSSNAFRAAEYIEEKTKNGILILTTHTEKYADAIKGMDVISI